MTLQLPGPHAIRNALTKMVTRDLLGPSAGLEEELDQREDHVYQRYLIGMLAPKALEIVGEEMDELATDESEDGEEGTAESGVPAGSTYFPSSMGMSFVVDGSTKEIAIETEWGRYLRIKSESQVKKDGNPAPVWKREHIIGNPRILEMKDGPIELFTPRIGQPLVVLQVRMRLTKDGWIVTVFLINNQLERKAKNEPKDEVWVFQPKIRVHCVDGQPIFVQRKGITGDRKSVV